MVHVRKVKNMKAVHRIAGLVMAAAVSLSLAACGNNSASQTAAGSYGPDAKIAAAKLTVMGFSDPDDVGKTRWDIAAKKISPATINTSTGAFDIQAFMAANAANNAPDLVYVQRDQISSLASLGALEPLDSCIAGESIPVDELNENSLAQSKFANETYGIPEFNQVQLTMANSDLLSKNGLTIDDVNGSSWDKIGAASQKLAKLDGGKLETIGYDPKLPEFLPLWAKANGADLISKDGKKAQLNDPKVVEALEFSTSLLKDSGGWAKVKSLRDAADMFGEGNQFVKNQLGAMNMEQWYIDVLNSTTPKAPVAFSPFLSKTTGKPIAFGTGSAWAIPSKAKNKAAACRFIKSMVSVDSWMAAAKVRAATRKKDGQAFVGLLTANTVADKKIRETYVKPTGSKKWDQAIDAQYQANDNIFFIAPNPAGEEFKKAWQDASNRVLAGQMTPKQSLEKAQKDAQSALDKAWAKVDAKK
jgi:multiple sugar transport system substrate-binding protein